MVLSPVKTYKKHDIYRDEKTNGYVVYDDNGYPIAREAVRLFVKNDIDINMKLLSYKSTKQLTEVDIDVAIILKRR